MTKEDTTTTTAESAIPVQEEVPSREEAEITLKELENHLYECANIIRNRVDKTDYKEYILPLIFYKAFDDTYEDNRKRVLEEKKAEGIDHQVALQLAHDEAFHEHRVPKEYRWRDLINADNTALAVDQALQEFQDINADFDGIATVEYSSVDAFTQREDNRLEELLRHLDDVNLSRYRVPPDLLGEAYMDLVKHFAEEEGRDGGEFFTPPELVELMVNLLEPYEKNTSIHDPTCGSGGMLIQVAQHLQTVQQVGEEHWRSIRFTGQEINDTVYAMAQMNLAIHDVTGEIRKGNSLSSPEFTTKGNELERFDYILANFPFSARWNQEKLEDDPYHRFDGLNKLPQKDRADYAFILHMAKQLNETGQAAIVVPHGVLFRNNESVFREHMIKQDLIEAVIGLPDNLFQNNTIPAAILILNAEKPEKRANSIQFIHADDEGFYEELSNQNRLLDEGIEEIAGIFKRWDTIEKRSRTVHHDEISENEYSLNVSLYVHTTEPDANINVSQELSKVRELRKKRNKIESRLDKYLATLGYNVETPPAQSGDTGNYIETPVGEVPPDWDVKRLDEVCRINPDSFSESNWSSKTFKYISLSDVSHGKILQSQTTLIDEAPSRAQRRIKPGDVLVGTVRPKQVSHGYVSEEHGGKVCSSGFGVLRSPPEVNSVYLMEEILSHRFFRQMEAYVAGGGYPAVNIGDLKKHRIVVPPIEEQQKIASILYSVDEAIEIQDKFTKISRDDDSGYLQRLKHGLRQDLLSGNLRTNDKDIEVLDSVMNHG